MGYFTKLRNELETYLEPAQIEPIEQAYRLARKAHQGQKRLTGHAYITHPVAVAHILAEMRMDAQSIMAAILHDTIEDTGIGKTQIAERFGDDVAELVDGVSKLIQIKFESREEAQAEYFRKMVLAMALDIRVIIVKLADRLHNMRTLEVLPREKKRRIALETLEIFARIANRLGMHAFYLELEELGFKALYPMRYRILNEAVNKAIGNRKVIIQEIEAALNKVSKKYHIDACKIHGRQKHLYSIYKKMRNNKASFAEIMDVYGFRIIVESNEDCYRALGAVHSLYKPLPERFKDYIALPKANGYQSLHTTLFGPFGVPIEIQIRTQEMDRVANVGVAAHWMYKQGETDQPPTQAQAQQWMQSLLELQESSGSSIEFIETVKIDLFPNEVYVFTPKGEIMELPRGATPVDFAYAVHSDIGNSCVAAKIDRRLAPLSMPLANGQKVEVITVEGASPNPAWLSFVVTGKARSNIRHFLKGRQRSESVAFGQRLLETALSEQGLDLRLLEDSQLMAVVKHFGYDSFDSLCEAIGLGNQVAAIIARHLTADKTPEAQHVALETAAPIAIKGTEGMVVSYAPCCRPIPGDPIVGLLQKGQGILVHVEPCPNVEKFRHNPEKFLSMCWEDCVEGEFLVDLHLDVKNQRGVLAAIASAVSDAEANIDNITVEPVDGTYNIVNLTLSVRDRIHLARILRRLRLLPAVEKITRHKLLDAS